MPTKPYNFRSVWELPAPRDEVWDLVSQLPPTWKNWWPQLTDIHSLRTTPTLVGSVFSCAWRSLLGYKVRCDFTVESLTPGSRVVFESSGDLVGQASMFLTDTPEGCKLVIDWNVTATKPFMRTFDRLLRPLFTYNHHYIMYAGEHGLRRYSKKARV